MESNTIVNKDNVNHPINLDKEVIGVREISIWIITHR